MKKIVLAPEVYTKAIRKHRYLSVEYIIGVVQEAICNNDYTVNEKGQLEILSRRRTNGKWVTVTFYVEDREEDYYVRVHVHS